jgi:hypothetical protein
VLLGRLSGRTELSREAALAKLGEGLPGHEVGELARLLEEEFGIPLGLLRPQDSLVALWAPVCIRQPLKWLWAQSALEDAVSEVNHQLQVRRQAKGQSSGPRLSSVRELFIAWCEQSAA